MKYTFRVKSASREFSVHVHEHSLLPGLLPNFAVIKVEDDAWNALIAVVTALVQGYMNNQ